MDLASIQQIAVASSAVVATLAFVYKVIDERRSRKAQERLDQKKAIEERGPQEIKVEWATFEQVADSYRGDVAGAFAAPLPLEQLTASTPKTISASLDAKRLVDRSRANPYPLLTYKPEGAVAVRLGEGPQAVAETKAGVAHGLPSHEAQLRSMAVSETKDLLQKIADLRARADDRPS